MKSIRNAIEKAVDTLEKKVHDIWIFAYKNFKDYELQMSRKVLNNIRLDIYYALPSVAKHPWVYRLIIHNPINQKM